MSVDTDPFIFPDMPDEAVAAIDQFLEAFYHRFQNHYFAQMHRWYHALDERESDGGPMSRVPVTSVWISEPARLKYSELEKIWNSLGRT